MKIRAWAWFGLLALPGCLLIQPLDEAKPEDDSGSSGKAGQHAGGGGPSAGGAGNKAGSGPAGGSSPDSRGGAANAGSGGVDFSLFLGRWTLTSGDYSKKCTSDTTTTTGTVDPGEVDTFVLGTQESQTDLIFDVQGTDVCNIFANVDDRSAYGTGDQACTVDEADGSTTYLTYGYFEFAVAADGQSALATWDVTALNDVAPLNSCDSEVRARFQRTDGSR